MADQDGQPTTLAEAKRKNSPTYRPKKGRNKGKIIAAVSKEELTASKMSLKEFLNKRRTDARKTGTVAGSVPVSKPKEEQQKIIKAAKKSAPKTKPVGRKTTDAGTSDWLKKKDQEIVGPAAGKTPKPKPTSKRKTSTGADLSASEIPKSKSRPRRGSSAPLSMNSLKGFEASSPFKKYADPYKDVGKGPRGQKGQAPVPTTEEKVAMAGLALSALGGPGTIAGKAAIKGATKFGKPFITNLIKKIKDLAPKQQKEVLQAVNKAPTKTAAQKETSAILKSGGRTQGSGRPLKRDAISKEAEAATNTRLTPRTRGQARADATTRAAQRALGRQEDTTLIGYNKGGKIYKRKKGGQVMSGSDLVSSVYD